MYIDTSTAIRLLDKSNPKYAEELTALHTLPPGTALDVYVEDTVTAECIGITGELLQFHLSYDYYTSKDLNNLVQSDLFMDEYSSIKDESNVISYTVIGDIIMVGVITVGLVLLMFL